jgi:hypothetical protein
VFDFLYNYALQVKKLDDSEFRNALSRSYVRVCTNLDALSIALFPSMDVVFVYYCICLQVREYDSKRDASRSPSRGRSYSKGRSYSRSRSRSRSVSRGRSKRFEWLYKVVDTLVCLGVFIVCQLFNCNNAASLQRPNLRAAHLSNCGQGLLRNLALALVQSLVLCQGMYFSLSFNCVFDS